MMFSVNSARHHAGSVAAPTMLPRSGTGSAAVPPSPPATRHRRPSWRDPRLVAGVVMVAGSVLLGSQLLAGADDTVTVWSARTALPAGTGVTAADLRPSQVRFTSDQLAERYVPTASAPEGMVLLRDVAAGELLPRAALGAAAAEETAELPVAVSSDAIPAGLRPGELVDVWVTPAQRSTDGGPAVRVLEQVPVVAVPQHSSALGPASTRQVVVGVPGADEDLVARALGRLSAGTAVVVRRG